MNHRSMPAATDEAEALRCAFRDDVLAGLAKSPKCIPAKHIYDARGSRLFEKITELDEYYLTRTERAIFDEHLPAMAQAIGPGATVIEPGAGSGEKAELLLDGLEDPDGYVPIEISHAALRGAVDRIRAAFPEVMTQPIAADFTQGDAVSMDGRARYVVFFPGSTIGNFEAAGRVRLWKRFAEFVGSEGHVLIGFDLVKPTEILIPAYDDAQGVTAEFNTNLLRRINNELAGDLDFTTFEYDVKWNDELDCVEMGQRSLVKQSITVAGRSFELAKGEVIRTERSHKFSLERMDNEAGEAGFRRVTYWMDERKWFGVGLYCLDMPRR